MKREETEESIRRYEQGLTIIDEASTKVDSLKQQIIEDEPKLEKLGIELVEQNKELKISLEETRIKNEEVTAKKEIQDVEVTKLQEITASIEKEKEETEKNKVQALKSADNLSSGDFTEINS